MSETISNHFNAEEFLSWAAAQGNEARYELWAGRAVAMAPPSTAHRRITARLVGMMIAAAERQGCAIEAPGVVPVSAASLFVPDLTMVCSGTDPRLIVEILSPSTQRNDQRVKIAHYHTLPWVSEILLIHADVAYAEVHRRVASDAERWLIELALGLDGLVRLETVGIAISLSELYAGLDLGESVLK